MMFHLNIQDNNDDV